MFSLQSDDGEIACVVMSGRVDRECLVPAGDPLESVLGTESSCRQVLLDLSGLEAMDSSGFCWLVRRQKRMRQQGGQIILHSAPPQLGQTLGRLNLHLLFCIARDRESAVRMARGDGRQPRPR